MDALRIQFWTTTAENLKDAIIEDLGDIPDEYFKSPKEDHRYLIISLLPSPGIPGGIDLLTNELADLKFDIALPGLEGLLNTDLALLLKGSQASTIGLRQFFNDVGGYVDSSRAAAIGILELRIKLLVENKLQGQMQCFLFIGMHGVGKSQFLMELGRWSAHIASPSHAFVYLPCNNKVAKSSLVKTIYDVAKYLGWIHDEPMWHSVYACCKWLNTSKRTLLLVLDEFDNIYRVDDDHDWISDLLLVGDMSGPRPLMVMLCGSAARLRSLCFKKMDHTDCVSLGYPGYKTSCNLNSTKFLPITLAPISSMIDMKRVFAVFNKSTPDDAVVWNLCCRTRGRIRQISDEFTTNDASGDHDEISGLNPWKTAFSNLSGDSKTVMELLWKCSKNLYDIRHQADIVSLYGMTDKWSKIMDISSVHGIDNLGNLLYDMADKGLISYDGNPTFGFVHPFDLWICSVLFDGYGHPRALSWAEKLSLHLPFNAGTDDVNERLVVQSFCENGLEIEGYPKLKFKDSFDKPCFTGYVRETKTLQFDTTPICRDDNIHPLSDKYLGTIEEKKCVVPAHFRKEYPDMAGGDAIAVFANKDKDAEYDFLVIRVQIKLGLSKSKVDNPIEKMVAHAGDLAVLMNAEMDRIRFIYVLWTSRPHCVPRDENYIVIDSEVMLKHWAEKVRSYVKSMELKSYGYNRVVSLVEL